MIVIVENEHLGTSYRVEWLWYLVQEGPSFTRRLYVRAKSKEEAIGYAMKWGVPRDQIAHVYEWGFNLDSPGVVLTVWSERHVEGRPGGEVCIQEVNDDH